MNFNSTVKGSALEGFYPAGWDFEKIDACIGAPETVCDRQAFWNDNFEPVKCDSLAEFETYMGHEIAMQIKLAKERDEKIAFILPVGPMGMYKWVVYFLKAWNVACDHVYTFNMDEWADADGNTLPSDNPGAFQYVMEQVLFNPLGGLARRVRDCRERLLQYLDGKLDRIEELEEPVLHHSGNPDTEPGPTCFNSWGSNASANVVSR